MDKEEETISEQTDKFENKKKSLEDDADNHRCKHYRRKCQFVVSFDLHSVTSITITLSQ